jgi:hypothetical protein
MGCSHQRVYYARKPLRSTPSLDSVPKVSAFRKEVQRVFHEEDDA